MSKIIVIGGGAAGMMSAILLGRKGHTVTLLEKNEKLGKKLFITGKGRCNFTNDCTRDEFLENVVTNPRFLYSALDVMNPQDVIALFESWGLATKVERGRRAFPASDHSYDVIDTLKKQLKAAGVKVMLHTCVTGLILEEGVCKGVKYVSSAETEVGERSGERRSDAGDKSGFDRVKTMYADRVIVATGGISYASTGSTGDGYRFAEEAGLHLTDRYPSLVPVCCAEEYCRTMQGLSLKNVELVVREGKKEIFREFGEMMFTHFGITGPIVLSMSAKIGKKIADPSLRKKPLEAWIDLKPAITEEQLDARFVRIFEENKNKQLKNVLGELYPSAMQAVIPAVSGVDDTRVNHDITKQERAALVQTTKHFPLTLTALRGYEEAVVTKGGVSVKDIDPKTMQAKQVPGLYFIGEVLDLDAQTGGYNLQIAWSTAASAAFE